MYQRLTLAWLLSALILAAPTLAEEPASLLSNGDFETADGDAPKDWPTPDGVTWEEEDGNRFLRLHADPDKMLTVYRAVMIKPEYEAFKLTYKVRVNELQRGKENWHDGRIILDFKDADGKKLKPSPGHPSFKGSTDGWVDKQMEFVVPEGAQRLEVMPAIFRGKSGSYDIDQIKLVPVDPEPVEADMRAEKRQKAAGQAVRAMRVKAQVPPVAPDQLPPALHVDGNQIVNADGEEVWLQGVSIPSMDWSGAGENILESAKVAIDDWNANVIRLPIKEHFWAGTGPWQSDGGAFYRQLVDDVVNLAAANGAYVVIDLHRFRAPRQVHADFWREVALIYRNHPAVLFEIFNEPHDISWEVWRNGGFVSTAKKADTDALAENRQKLEGFDSIGMQGLVDTIRTAGARNIIIAGGLDWSYDLSGILNGYALDNHGGNGIVYSTHVYPWKSDWQNKFITAAEQYPIFIGECGAPQERFHFIPESRHEDPSTWVPDFLGLIQKHKYHWAAWAFHPKAGPPLLSDWDYTPNDYWGKPAKAALNGKQFELTKLR